MPDPLRTERARRRRRWACGSVGWRWKFRNCTVTRWRLVSLLRGGNVQSGTAWILTIGPYWIERKEARG